MVKTYDRDKGLKWVFLCLLKGNKNHKKEEI